MFAKFDRSVTAHALVDLIVAQDRISEAAAIVAACAEIDLAGSETDPILRRLGRLTSNEIYGHIVVKNFAIRANIDHMEAEFTLGDYVPGVVFALDFAVLPIHLDYLAGLAAPATSIRMRRLIAEAFVAAPLPVRVTEA